MPTPECLTIATRESALALWQAHHVRDRLRSLHPSLEVRILGMTTEGDRRLSSSLAKIGGKGLFVKELEAALECGQADLAVHSMKDVPMHLPEGLALAAILEREDPRDAFVSNRHRALSALPPGARVGTSSLRRESQIRARYPHLHIEPLRGNVNTRLRKLDEGEYDGIILAAAGLRRLNFSDRITAVLEPADSIPAVGQGALGIECLAGRQDVYEFLRPLVHEATSWCVHAERAVSRALAGSCVVPLGAFAQVEAGAVRLDAFVASPDGRRMARAHARVPDMGAAPGVLAEQAVAQLVAQGAREILADLPPAH